MTFIPDFRRHVHRARPLILLFLLGLSAGATLRNDHAYWAAVSRTMGGETQASMMMRVIKHYPRWSKKDRAVRFLMRNIPYHQAYGGTSLAAFRNVISSSKDSIDATDATQMDSLWLQAAADNDLPVLKPLASQISEEFIISHVDSTFASWQRVPWKRSISWKVFLNHVLPFQVDCEPVYNCRDSLRHYYAPVIQGIEDPFEAYCAIRRDIIRHFTILSEKTPHNYSDPMVLHRIMKGTCNDRSTYITTVLRALCIPAAFDYCPRYANYSRNLTHSWVPYIAGDHTLYTVRNDSIKQRNFVIALWQNAGGADTAGTPFRFDSVKTIAKVWRKSYAPSFRRDLRKFPNIPSDLYHPLHTDVSADYGKHFTLDFRLRERSREPVYLCTFLSGTGWKPIAVAKSKGCRVRFRNVSAGVCYIPLSHCTDESRKTSESAIFPPVLLDTDGAMRVLAPDTTCTEHAELRRKYLIVSSFPISWSLTIGSCFEASDVAGFADSSRIVLLHAITTMPIGPTRVQVDAARPYRYVRYRATQKHVRMAEVAFFGQDSTGIERELTGKIIFDSIPETNALNIFDKDYATETCVNRILPPAPYWIGYDLGADNMCRVTRIEYSTYSDCNFIEPGDLYELFYFDQKRGWVSLGQQTSPSEVLHYDIPRNALLWLRDLSKGREERIFTYENGRQVWW